MTFKSDYELGRIAEDGFAAILEATGWTVTYPPNAGLEVWKGWDLSCTHPDKKAFTCEVKHDQLGHKTKNAYVQYERFDKKLDAWVDAGIRTTIADYWVFKFIDIDDYYVITTGNLKIFWAQNFNLGRIRQGGVNYDTMGVLVPRAKIFEYSYIFKPLN